MAHNILLTGVSGYLGGTLLAQLSSADLPAYNKLYALVRTPEQAEAVKQYDAHPLTFDVYDETTARQFISDHRITIVYWLVDAVKVEAQRNLIRALAEVKRAVDVEVHFLHTTGAKIFSSHAGAPTDRVLCDNDPELYDIQKKSKAPHAVMQRAVDTNCEIIELAESLGVRSYIFAPCIVYGKGEGFGNKISIQTTAIVQAAKATRQVYRTDSGSPTWPVCHIADNTSLYIQLLRAILEGSRPDHGKQGYYLASSGDVVWDDLYAAFATSLAKRGVVENDEVKTPDEDALVSMARALKCPKEFVPVMVGGKCTFAAEHGKQLGWKTSFPASHAIDDADNEVEWILQNLKD